MNIVPLQALSPIDGRYYEQLAPLSEFFSEFALIRARTKVEVEYLIALCKLRLPQLPLLKANQEAELRAWIEHFTLHDAERIKEIEKETNHDVKAVEYYLVRKMENSTTFEPNEIKQLICFIHFGLTSQDINNTAYPMLFQDAVRLHYLPLLNKLIEKLENLSKEWKDECMLAYTHGQPASPTAMGKELNVFIERLLQQRLLFRGLPFPAKFGGATGNFNAHLAAFPNINWQMFANVFVENILRLSRNQTTTQIDHYDGFSALFDAMRRINVILIDLCKDVWAYISLEYFKIAINTQEVGSSTMPHKVNPIDFENAEGNLLYANAIFDFMSNKLPVSRLQRDLTDSTILRNMGVPFAHTFLAMKMIEKGLKKLRINSEKLLVDLNSNWAVVSEAIQSIMRREGDTQAYNKLKELTRKGTPITKESIYAFIDTLDVSEKVKDEMKQISPTNYTGYATQMSAGSEELDFAF